jgi:hypothetical protein
MRFIINGTIYLLLLFIIIFPVSANAGDNAFEVEIKGKQAEVSLIQGKADIIKKGMTEPQSLIQGNYVADGDKITTKKDSRIELKLPDDSVIRFDELTTFEIVCVEFDKKTKKRNVNVSMLLGKTWAKVSKSFGRKGRFAVSTKTAVAGVRGTVYRVNVAEDNTVKVKVYWGEVGVSSPPKTDAGSQTQKSMQPYKVSGPHPVAGPHPVSMEEWTYIVKSMQQITILPDGTPTKPMPFLASEDINEWVLWNQELDKKN